MVTGMYLSETTGEQRTRPPEKTGKAQTVSKLGLSLSVEELSQVTAMAFLSNFLKNMK